jgi:hypothetical protein
MYRPLAAFCFALTFLSAPSVANDFAVEWTMGRTMPDAQGYRNSASNNLAFALKRDNWIYRLGYIQFGKFELGNSPEQTYIDIDGVYLQASRRFERDILAIETGAGFLASSAEAVFGGNRLDKDRDVSPFVELRAILAPGNRWRWHGGYRYFADVSGSDLRNPFVGVSFSF